MPGWGKASVNNWFLRSYYIHLPDMEEWRTHQREIAAGSYKWRADEFYARAHNKPQHMFAPDWLEGHTQSLRSMKLPTATLRANSLTTSRSLTKLSMESQMVESPSRAGRAVSASGSFRTTDRPGEGRSPSGTGEWGWCLPKREASVLPDIASPSSDAGWRRPSTSHQPVKETSVWPSAVPPQRMALQA